MRLGGPVWHVSVAQLGVLASRSPEDLARLVLAGVGDASLGEWVERRGRFVHVRRRLSAAEQDGVGEVRDVRRTPEALARARRVPADRLRLVPHGQRLAELGLAWP